MTDYAPNVITNADGPGPFAVPFPYADAAHVKAEFADGTPCVVAFVTASTITVSPEGDGSQDLAIYRDTAIDAPAVTFRPGAVSSRDLNVQTLQLLYRIQEEREAISRGVLLPRGETGPLYWPTLDERSGYFAAWDADGELTPASGTGADSALRSDLAASTGGSLVATIATGVGAIIRSVLSKLRDRVTFEDYDCAGDGIEDDAANVRKAIAANAGKVIYGKGTYLLGSSLGDIPVGTKIVLENRTGTAKFVRGYSASDYLMNLLNGAELEGWVEGNGKDSGGTLTGITGGLVNIPVGHGNQSIRDARLINAVGGTPLHIECTGALDSQVGGSRMDISNLEVFRSDSTPGSGRYAIVHDDPGVPAAGHPISIHHLETGGYESIAFGACNNLSMTGCTVFDVLLSVNTRGLRATTNRWAGTSTITLRGASQFSACSFGPAITVEAGAVAMFDPACLFNSPVTDNSGVAGVCHFWDAGTRTFTPDWEAGGTNIAEGATGLVQGFQRRRGDKLHLGVRLKVEGAGASIPAGAITIEAPMIADADWMEQTVFHGHVITAAGAKHPIQGSISGGQTEITFRCSDGSALTDASFSTSLPYTIIVNGEYLV